MVVWRIIHWNRFFWYIPCENRPHCASPTARNFAWTSSLDLCVVQLNEKIIALFPENFIIFFKGRRNHNRWNSTVVYSGLYYRASSRPKVFLFWVFSYFGMWHHAALARKTCSRLAKVSQREATPPPWQWFQKFLIALPFHYFQNIDETGLLRYMRIVPGLKSCT